MLGSDVLQIGDKFTIKNRAWMVQEKDNFDENGVVYYSLVATTIGKDKNYQAAAETDIKPQIVEDKNPLTFTPGEQIKVSTYRGVFKTNCSSVEVINRTSEQVVFTIPFGVDEVEVTTSNEYGELITDIYRKEF